VQGISKDNPRDHTSSAEARIEEPLRRRRKATQADIHRAIS
jgi:hypothetical protein